MRGYAALAIRDPKDTCDRFHHDVSDSDNHPWAHQSQLCFFELRVLDRCGIIIEHEYVEVLVVL